jgi:hypothetical protein
MSEMVDEICKLCVAEREKMPLHERARTIRGRVYYRGENHLVTKFTDNAIKTLCGAEKLPPNPQQGKEIE